MQSDLPKFDALHVISDLHMGGVGESQILKECARLANYILRLKDEKTDQELALVLNGDVFDTLPEDGMGEGKYVATTNAVEIVTRIINDPSFKPIWDALSAFVKAERRTLVFVIGNHDIEIALPVVQYLIVSVLAGQDLQAKARIQFSVSGAGFACYVGRSKVYCTHGNEFDAWNWNDYQALSKLSRRVMAGTVNVDEGWEPNAGTKLVRDVINHVKQKYPWIDLFKPEKEAALRTLLALDLSQLKRIPKLPTIGGKWVKGAVSDNQRLSSDSNVSGSDMTEEAEAMDKLLAPLLGAGKALHSAEAMYQVAEHQFKNPQRFTADQEDGALGLVGDIVAKFNPSYDKKEWLRSALSAWVKDDRSFDVSADDETSSAALKHVGISVDFVVAGHTHLARAIMRENRVYFNSGTWIRLMKMSDEVLKDEESFAPVYDLLCNASMKSLDEFASKNDGLMLDRTTEVAIFVRDGKTIGELNQIEADGSGAPRRIDTLTWA